jgi:hypothetical protein
LDVGELEICLLRNGSEDEMIGSTSTVSTVQSPQYSLHSTVSTVQSPQYSLHSTVSTVQSPQYSLHSAVSTVQSPSLETNNSSIRPEIPRILCYLTVHYVMRSGPPMVPLLS